MKLLRRLITIVCFIAGPAVNADEKLAGKEEDPAKKAPEATLRTLPELSSLAHACDLVRAINAGNWKDAETMTNSSPFLPLLQGPAKAKDWHGVGAYRGTDHEFGKLTHRFVYGAGPKHPHELWITYSIKDDKMEFKSIFILGW